MIVYDLTSLLSNSSFYNLIQLSYYDGTSYYVSEISYNNIDFEVDFVDNEYILYITDIRNYDIYRLYKKERYMKLDMYDYDNKEWIRGFDVVDIQLI